MDGKLNQLAKVDDFRIAYILAQYPHEDKFRAATYEEFYNWLNVRLEISGIEMAPVKGGVSEAESTIIAPGPSGQNRKMDASPGWYSVGGVSVEAEKGKVWKWFWNGSAWALVEMGDLPEPDLKKDLIIYPNIDGYKEYQFIIEGKIYNSNNPAKFKWTGFLPITNQNDIVIEGVTSDYTANSFYDHAKNHISNFSLHSGNGVIPKESIPIHAKYIGKNLHYSSSSVQNPDVSETARIYTRDSLEDAISARVGQFQAEIAIDKIKNDEVYEKRHGITTYQGVDNLIYSAGYINGNPDDNFGGAFPYPTRSRTPYYDVKQANRIILSGWTPTLPVNRFFYDKDLRFIGNIQGVNGVFDRKEWPANAAYFAFTSEMDAIKLTGQEKVRIVVNGDTENIEYYKKELYEVFTGSQSTDGQQLNGAGTVINVVTASWSGYVPIPADTDLQIEGLALGFNTKAFYGESFNLLGTYSVNNGVVPKTVIPQGTVYIGFNTRTEAVGDSRPTTKMYYLYSNINSSSAGGDIPALTIPSIIPVVIGLQGNIYKDNIRPNPINDSTELFFNEGEIKTGTSANPYTWKTREVERALQYMPQVAENVEMIAQMRDREYNVLTQRKFTFVGVPSSAGLGQRKTIILAGDSQIDTSLDGSKTSFAPYLKDLFDQSGSVEMIFVGARSYGTTIYGDIPSENRTVSCPTEGQGSTTLGWFLGMDIMPTKPNPFLNGSGQFDLAMYWNNAKATGNPYGLQPSDSLDYFLTPSGTNDFSIYRRSPGEVVELMKELYSKVIEAFPACKFIIGIPTLGSKLWSMDTRRKWSIDYFRALIAEFEKPEYMGKAYLSAAALWTDNIWASRQLRTVVEPYSRISDIRVQLYNKAVQQGMSTQEAEILVDETYGFKVEERVLSKWNTEYPGTNDVTHSGYIGAMQQADCYYSTLKFSLI